MLKLFKKNIKEEIKSGDLKREVVIDKDGEKIVLSEAGLVKYLEDLFEGGKSISQALKEMIKDGIKDKQWERRQEIEKLLEQIKIKDEELIK